MGFGGVIPQRSKRQGETSQVTFDFTGLLAVGETISTYVVAATIYSGVDADPTLIIDGPASASGLIVSQTITGGVEGVIYQLVCTITTSIANTVQQSSYLAVVPPLT